MSRRPTGSPRRALAAVLLIAATTMLAACGGGGGGGDEGDDALPTEPPPATLQLLPSATPRATATATPGGEDEDAASTGGPAALPADPEAVIVQLARIEHSAWEPAIKGQMAPHFSLQANGFAVFQSAFGESLDGWYQSAILPHEAEALLRTLVDDIGVLELAASRPEEPLAFTFDAEGEPEGCGAYGVIFVQSAQRKGRLVISECELEAPEGPDAEALTELNEVVNVLESWKNIVDHAALAPPPTEEAGSRRPTADLSDVPPEGLPDAFRSLIGFYSPIRQPYTPDSVVAFGTRARSSIPSDALRVTWPITPLLGMAFDADYGADPAELRLVPPDSTAVLREELIFHRARPASFWGPLWEDPEGAAGSDDLLYSVGVRPSVPGGNEVILDYAYSVPRRGIGIGR